MKWTPLTWYWFAGRYGLIKMNLPHIIFFTFLFLCTEAQSKTLENLATFLGTHGTEKLIELTNQEAIENEGKRYLLLKNELRKMGNQEIVTPISKWELGNLSSGKGISISLTYKHNYLTNNPVSTLGLVECTTNLATSGIAYVNLPNSTVFNFTWSCGTLGCSYQAKLGEGFAICS